MNKRIFEYFNENYGLILLESEIEDIKNIFKSDFTPLPHPFRDEGAGTLRNPYEPEGSTEGGSLDFEFPIVANCEQEHYTEIKVRPEPLKGVRVTREYMIEDEIDLTSNNFKVTDEMGVGVDFSEVKRSLNFQLCFESNDFSFYTDTISMPIVGDKLEPIVLKPEFDLEKGEVFIATEKLEDNKTEIDIGAFHIRNTFNDLLLVTRKDGAHMNIKLNQLKNFLHDCFLRV